MAKARGDSAARVYQTLLRNSGPQGVAGFNWNEAQSLFAQGRAAMWLDGVGFAPPLENRERSRIVGKVGYGIFPAGPKAHHAAMFGDGIGIAAGFLFWVMRRRGGRATPGDPT